MLGTLGGLCMVWGVAMLWRVPHTTLGCSLISGAVLCFAIEAWVQTKFIAGIVGTLLGAFGFWKFCAGEPRIVASVAFPISAVLGGVSLWVLGIAKQARANKFDY